MKDIDPATNMLLELDQTACPMKLVFKLSENLKSNPERVSITQALTLNKAKTAMGLKGSNGLFGSQEWWNSIYSRKMPLLFISGVITNVYEAGQDRQNINNTIELRLADGSITHAGIYTNDKNDIELFKAGHKAEIVYALDELKQQPGKDGEVNRSKTALEMAVSLSPVAQN